MARPITKDKVVELLRDGWELGKSDYIRGGAMITMQRKLGQGGEHYTVHVGSFYALRDKGVIEQIPGQSLYSRQFKYRLKAGT